MYNATEYTFPFLLRGIGEQQSLNQSKIENVQSKCPISGIYCSWHFLDCSRQGSPTLYFCSC